MQSISLIHSKFPKEIKEQQKLIKELITDLHGNVDLNEYYINTI